MAGLLINLWLTLLLWQGLFSLVFFLHLWIQIPRTDFVVYVYAHVMLCVVYSTRHYTFVVLRGDQHKICCAPDPWCWSRPKAESNIMDQEHNISYVGRREVLQMFCCPLSLSLSPHSHYINRYQQFLYERVMVYIVIMNEWNAILFTIANFEFPPRWSANIYERDKNKYLFSAINKNI